MITPPYIIPSGYKGISHDITFNMETKLAVITGLNGCGKTTLLKHIFENNNTKKNIFFKTQSTEQNFNSPHRIRRRRFYMDDNEIPTFDSIMEVVYGEFERYTGDKQYIHRHDVFAMLFDINSYLYEDGHEFLNNLCKGLRKFDDIDSIRKKLGVPTATEIENKIIEELNKKIRKDKSLFKKYKRGKLVYNNQDELSLIERRVVQIIKGDVTAKLKKEFRKNSKINDKASFESYIHELVLNFSFSIESIIEKMSQRIYEDVKGKGAKKDKLWKKINDELEKYNKDHFRYKINAPTAYSSNYEINFQSIDGNKEVHFDSLSSGEKIVFELLCYYLIAEKDNSGKNKKLELVILDEFDANLNPALVDTYLTVIRKQFCDKGIRVILTTHSPSTVAALDAKELFELSLENGKQTINCAKNEDGKKEILKKLAPKFVYHSEFGNLEYVLKDHSNTIVLLEGKEDLENFQGIKDYTFIHCTGADNIRNILTCFQTIPFFEKILRTKVIIALFDFDKKGRECIQNLLGADKNDCLTDQINNKESPYIHYRDNVYLAMLKPPEDGEKWDYMSKPFRHEELKKEKEEGLKRQISLINEIRTDYEL